MKITLSRAQWEGIGKKAGWAKIALSPEAINKYIQEEIKNTPSLFIQNAVFSAFPEWRKAMILPSQPGQTLGGANAVIPGRKSAWTQSQYEHQPEGDIAIFLSPKGVISVSGGKEQNNAIATRLQERVEDFKRNMAKYYSAHPEELLK